VLTTAFDWCLTLFTAVDDTCGDRDGRARLTTAVVWSEVKQHRINMSTYFYYWSRCTWRPVPFLALFVCFFVQTF